MLSTRLGARIGCARLSESTPRSLREADGSLRTPVGGGKSVERGRANDVHVSRERARVQVAANCSGGR